jgi:hypothetical protein
MPEVHIGFGGKPEGRRPLGSPRYMWEDDIKMYLREVEGDGNNLIHLTQDKGQWRAFVNVIINFLVP